MAEPAVVRRRGESGGSDLSAFAKFVQAGGPGAHAHVVFLGLRKFDAATLLELVREGLTYDSFERLQGNLELSQAELLEIVQIPQRTLARRRKEKHLRPDESDRLLRASRVFGRAVELFGGDARAARSWLATPQTVLGGSVPWHVASTELGAREVESALGRIEHGVFA